MKLTRRPVRMADEPFLVSLHADILPDGLPPFLADMQYRAELAGYTAQYGGDGHEIIEAAGRPVGRWWVHYGEAETRLVDIRIASIARGRGIGTHLIGELQSGADRPILLSVAVSNPSALRFYARLGFRQIAHTGVHIAMEWLPR